MSTEPETKNIVTSKTSQVAAVITLASWVSPQVREFVSAHPAEAMTIVTTIFGIVLRLITNKGIHILPKP